MPTVSVTIPCYNGESYIETAIRSVLAQTFPDLEIVVVDDGSHDRTGEIVQGIKDDRIRYFYQENQGLAQARNRLIDLAKGDYVAFLDQDDYWEPRKLEKQVAVFRNNPQTALVYADCYIVDACGRIMGKWSQRCKLYQGWVFDRLLLVNFIPLPTVLMKTATFHEIGRFLPYKFAEEYDLFLKLAARFPFDYLAEPLAYYRVHPGQFSRNYEIALEERLAIYKGWLHQTKESDINRSVRIARSLAISYFIAGKSAIYLDSDTSKARGYFRRSLEHYPNWKAILFCGLSFLGPTIIKWTRRIVVKMLGIYSFLE